MDAPAFVSELYLTILRYLQEVDKSNDADTGGSGMRDFNCDGGSDTESCYEDVL